VKVFTEQYEHFQPFILDYSALLPSVTKLLLITTDITFNGATCG